MRGDSNEYDELDVVTKEQPGEDFRDLVMEEELVDIGIDKKHDIYQTIFLLAKRIKALEEKK